MATTLRKLRIPVALLAIVVITLAVARYSGPPHHGKWFAAHRNAAVTRTFRDVVVRGTDETAATRLSFRPDSGTHGNTWAYDSFTRSDHMVRMAAVSPAHCGFTIVHSCWQWMSTITDNPGSFQTIIGQVSPGTQDAALRVVEQGAMAGGQAEIVYDSYANAFPGDVPAAENDNGVLPAGNSTSTGWPCQFFGGAGSCHPQGASTFSYSYALPAGADTLCPTHSWHWLNASDGNVGDILAPDRASCATSPSNTLLRMKFHGGPAAAVLASAFRPANTSQHIVGTRDGVYVVNRVATSGGQFKVAQVGGEVFNVIQAGNVGGGYPFSDGRFDTLYNGDPVFQWQQSQSPGGCAGADSAFHSGVVDGGCSIGERGLWVAVGAWFVNVGETDHVDNYPYGEIMYRNTNFFLYFGNHQSLNNDTNQWGFG